MKIFSAPIALIALTLFCAGSRNHLVPAEADRSQEPPVAKVKIHKGGGVSLDGQRVSLDELRERLKKHKEANGVVWYYRESAEAKSQETGEAVIKIIIELKLPVRLMENEEK